MDIAVQCYGATKSFPADEKFGLTSQIRRASTSVAANIAEGYGRETTGSYIQFLRNAQGSLKELETHLLLAYRVGFLDEGSCGSLSGGCDEIGRMLRALIRTLQEK